MNWILLLYVLPFFLSIILGYKASKKLRETKGQYLLGTLIMLVPLLNIVFIVVVLVEYLKESKTIKSIKKYLNQPL